MIPNNDQEFPNPEKFITPENITNEQRDALVPIWNAEVEAMLQIPFDRIRKGSIEAAEQQDGERLKRALQAAKAYQAKLSQWNESAGERANEKLKLWEESFGALADNILAALNGELPGQRESDSGEDWENS